MNSKKLLFIPILIYFFWGCSSNKLIKTENVENPTEEVEAISEKIQISDDEQSKSKEDTEILRKLYKEAINYKNSGNREKAKELFEEALNIITNNETKYTDIYKNNDDYNEIVDIIIEDYKDFMNEKVRNSNESNLFDKVETVEITPSPIHTPSKYKEVPIILNNNVKKYIEYFQGRGKKHFSLWLERMGKYKPVISDILKKEGLPEDLIYLAMIESGFSPNAHSKAGAVGIWQFISSTGRLNGLQVNNYVDERKDPIKSTNAASTFLKNLYEEFDDWYLVMSAYNVSKTKVKQSMIRYKSNDFWNLKSLPRETRNHIPKIIAATIISKNPEQYGFKDIKYQTPLQYEEVNINKCIDLTVASKCAETDYLEMKELNPELKSYFTPPYPNGYNLKIPKGKREIFLKNYEKVPDEQKITRIIHSVKKDETLSIIARKYHTTIYNIKSVNSLNDIHKLSIGQSLLIPVNPHSEIVIRNTRNTDEQKSITPKNQKNLEEYTYIVKKGDTLSEIAEYFNTKPSNIRSWNSLSYSNNIYPGQKLTIWIDKKDAPNNKSENIIYTNEKSYENKEIKSEKTYIVKKGDTLWQISKYFGVNLDDLLKVNQKNKNSKIKPGEEIKIPILD